MRIWTLCPWLNCPLRKLVNTDEVRDMAENLSTAAYSMERLHLQASAFPCQQPVLLLFPTITTILCCSPQSSLSCLTNPSLNQMLNKHFGMLCKALTNNVVLKIGVPDKMLIWNVVECILNSSSHLRWGTGMWSSAVGTSTLPFHNHLSHQQLCLTAYDRVHWYLTDKEEEKEEHCCLPIKCATIFVTVTLLH